LRFFHKISHYTICYLVRWVKKWHFDFKQIPKLISQQIEPHFRFDSSNQRIAHLLDFIDAHILRTNGQPVHSDFRCTGILNSVKDGSRSDTPNAVYWM
uniref:Transposase n=1 Tax=Ascaris lumbricoides TaxID=6252 RepID=A0A0M3HK86_ASCLU